jgi:hypothetical protein
MVKSSTLSSQPVRGLGLMTFVKVSSNGTGMLVSHSQTPSMWIETVAVTEVSYL